MLYSFQGKQQLKVQYSGEGFKYFPESQIKLIRRTARDRTALALQKNRSMAVREVGLG
jgi:hypothetical protein